MSDFIVDFYERLYSNNQDFKTYVDKYCNKNNISPREAFYHVLIQKVGTYYNDISHNTKTSDVNNIINDLTEDKSC